MVNRAKASHIGGALSIADILAVLYSEIMNYNIKNAKDPSRDKLILSKGHNGVALYATLAEIGFIDKKTIEAYYSDGSVLSGHISHKDVNGVEFSTGSLGHGACVAAGMAKAAKLDNKKNKFYTIVGDGECNEGSIWEMAAFVYHHKIDNLTVIIDHNKLQSITFCKDTIDPINLKAKWDVFGWHTLEIDGHNHNELKEALSVTYDNVPKCIIAHTIKGKGVSFMENNNLWHYRDPQGELFEKAVAELENAQ